MATLSELYSGVVGAQREVRTRRSRLLADVEALALGVRVSRGLLRHGRRHGPAHRLDVVLDQRRDLVRLPTHTTVNHLMLLSPKE
jgi:hypothetical protein